MLCATQRLVSTKYTNFLAPRIPVQVQRTITSSRVLALDGYVDFGELRPSDTSRWDALTDMHAHPRCTIPQGPDRSADTE